MTMTSTAPKTRKRYCWKLGTALRMTSGTTTMTAAPTIDPQTLPIPPSTTIERMKIEINRVKSSGLTKLTRLALTTPATPAVDAPMAKAHSFILTVGTPMPAPAKGRGAQDYSRHHRRDEPHRQQ